MSCLGHNAVHWVVCCTCISEGLLIFLLCLFGAGVLASLALYDWSVPCSDFYAPGFLGLASPCTNLTVLEPLSCIRTYISISFCISSQRRTVWASAAGWVGNACALLLVTDEGWLSSTSSAQSSIFYPLKVCTGVPHQYITVGTVTTLLEPL